MFFNSGVVGDVSTSPNTVTADSVSEESNKNNNESLDVLKQHLSNNGTKGEAQLCCSNCQDYQRCKENKK